MEDNIDLRELGKTPVSEDSPAGKKAIYEPEYQELEEEISKLSKPSSGEDSGVDWNKVSRLAAVILAGKSKDMLVASRLAVAQLYIGKVEGMALGIHIYRDLLDTFWDGLNPPKKRKQGRINAIMWWMEKTEQAMPQVFGDDGPEPAEPELIEQMNADLNQIDSALVDNLGDDAPMIRPFKRLIEALPIKESEPEPEPEPEKPEAPVEPEKPAATVEPEKPAAEAPKPEAAPAAPVEAAPEPAGLPESQVKDPESLKEARTLIRDGFLQIRKAAAVIRDADPADPQAYRLSRMASWATLENLPPAVDGKTRIPPPTAQVRNIIDDLKSKQDWPNLIKSAEQNLSRSAFWLDLNRLTADGLGSLGDKYQRAETAVRQETGMLIHRLAGLENLSFSDGSPFADDETRQWLKTLSLGSGAGGGLAPGGPSPDDGAMAETMEEARKLAREKKLPEALAMLNSELRTSGSQRTSLQWRIEICRLLVQGGRGIVALPHMEHILADIDQYRLEQWEPDLARLALDVLRAGFSTLPDEDYGKIAGDMLKRISKIDPGGALALVK